MPNIVKHRMLGRGAGQACHINISQYTIGGRTAKVRGRLETV